MPLELTAQKPHLRLYDRSLDLKRIVCHGFWHFLDSSDSINVLAYSQTADRGSNRKVCLIIFLNLLHYDSITLPCQEFLY